MCLMNKNIVLIITLVIYFGAPLSVTYGCVNVEKSEENVTIQLAETDLELFYLCQSQNNRCKDDNASKISVNCNYQNCWFPHQGLQVNNVNKFFPTANIIAYQLTGRYNSKTDMIRLPNKQLTSFSVGVLYDHTTSILMTWAKKAPQGMAIYCGPAEIWTKKNFLGFTHRFLTIQSNNSYFALQLLSEINLGYYGRYDVTDKNEVITKIMDPEKNFCSEYTSEINETSLSNYFTPVNITNILKQLCVKSNNKGTIKKVTDNREANNEAYNVKEMNYFFILFIFIVFLILLKCIWSVLVNLVALRRIKNSERPSLFLACLSDNWTNHYIFYQVFRENLRMIPRNNVDTEQHNFSKKSLNHQMLDKVVENEIYNSE